MYHAVKYNYMGLLFSSKGLIKILFGLFSNESPLFQYWILAKWFNAIHTTTDPASLLFSGLRI